MVTVFHMLGMRNGYLNNNTHRTFDAWLLPFSFMTEQP